MSLTLLARCFEFHTHHYYTAQVSQRTALIDMSRHRNVRTLDISQEMDDFEYDDEEDYEGGVLGLPHHRQKTDALQRKIH